MNRPEAKTFRERDFVTDGNLTLLRFLQLLGSYPVPETKQGCMSWSSLYCVLMSAIFVVLTIFNISFGLISKMNDLPTDDKPFMYASLLFTLIPVTNLLIIWDSKKVMKYLEDWQYFQNHFQAVTGRILHVNYKRQQILLIGGSIMMGIILAADTTVILSEFTKKTAISFDEYSVYIHCLIIVYDSCVLFATWGLWWYLLRTLRDTTGQLLSAFQESDSSVRSIVQCRRLWRELRELTCGLSGTFSSSLLVYVVYGFTASMACWYMTITTNIGDLFLNIAISSSVTLFITAIPEYCYQTSEKVGTSFQKIISKMRMKGTSDEVEKQLLIFEICIVEFPPNFAVAGCFTLNRHFSLTVYINYAQAMVIIYQLLKTSS